MTPAGIQTTGGKAGAPVYWTPAGRFADFRLDAVDGEAVATWEVDSFASPWAVAVYKNGVFQSPLATGSRWSDALADVEDGVAQYDFFVVPRMAYYERLRLRTYNTTRRIRATWELGEGVQRVTVHKNTVPSLEVPLEDGDAVADLRTPRVTCADSRVTISGRWVGDTTEAVIACRITSGGAVGTAIFTWTYGGESSEISTREYPQLLVNGVRLAFSPGSSFTYGEEFDVVVSLPTQWLSGDLPNGRHRVVVQTWRNQLPTASDMEEVTILAVPGSPVLDTAFSSYANGTGVATIGWNMPTEVGIREAWIYRNYPADGQQAIHWRPVSVHTATPGGLLIVQVSDLQPGLNRVGCRVLNDGEFNDDSEAIYEVLLDADLDKIFTANPPWEVRAVQERDMSVTYTVKADRVSDDIIIYHDNRTGTVDYSTPVAVISNPQGAGVQTLSSRGHFLADGDYIIAARARAGSAIEQNTDITYAFTYDSTLAPAAENLTLEAV